MKIRKAESRDTTRIIELLYQVAKIHADARPDIFKNATKKYSDQELAEILANDNTPVFVAIDDRDVVMGYAFCVFQVIQNNRLLQDKKTLYIDDICVDETARGTHIGKRLYEHVKTFAQENGFDNITLNVWRFNEGAYQFYENCGMTEQRIIMEETLSSQT